MDDLTSRAYNDFMTRLFGHVPKNPQEHEVTRERYTEVMHEVQKEYGMTQGHPEFLPFILTMVGRSPKIVEGAGTNESTAEPGSEETVGTPTLRSTTRE